MAHPLRGFDFERAHGFALAPVITGVSKHHVLRLLEAFEEVRHLLDQATLKEMLEILLATGEGVELVDSLNTSLDDCALWFKTIWFQFQRHAHTVNDIYRDITSLTYVGKSWPQMLARVKGETLVSTNVIPKHSFPGDSLQFTYPQTDTVSVEAEVVESEGLRESKNTPAMLTPFLPLAPTPTSQRDVRLISGYIGKIRMSVSPNFFSFSSLSGFRSGEDYQGVALPDENTGGAGQPRGSF